MNILLKLVLRNVKSSKLQLIAATVVIFVGILFFTSLTLTYANLKANRDVFYDKYNFEHYSIKTNNISSDVVGKLTSIEGVKAVSGRISYDVGMDMPSSDKRVTARLISLPDKASNSTVDNVFVKSGMYFSEEPNTVMVDNKFANYHKIKSGDYITLMLGEQKVKYKVSGLVISPEYVYSMKTIQDLTPAIDSFGAVFLSESQMKRIFSTNAYNELVFVWKSDYIDREDRIIKNIKVELSNYSNMQEKKRKDQLSNMILQNNIDQMATFSALFPALFLLVSCLIIYMLLVRLVESYRSQIGLLMAFGYSSLKIFMGYSGISLVIGLVGGTLGAFGGKWVGMLIGNFYIDYFSMPQQDTNTGIGVYLISILIAVLISAFAGFIGIRSIIRITPNDAFLAVAPKIKSRSFLNRIFPFWNHMSISWRLSIRNLFRNTRRSQFTLLGSVFSGALIIVSFFFPHGMQMMIDSHFYEKQHQDYTVGYSLPVSINTVNEFTNFKYISKVEPILEWYFEVSFKDKKREILFTGLPKSVSLYEIKDEEKNRIMPPSSGVLLPLKLKDKWNIKIGDQVTLYNKIGKETETKVSVAGFANEFVGESAYMDIESLGSAAGIGNVSNKALLSTSSGKDKEVLAEVKNNPQISFVEGRKAQADTFVSTYMGAAYTFVLLLVVFSTVMGFVVVFNTTTINLLERKNEIGMLKLIGYNTKSINKTLKKESLILCLSSLIFGIPLGLFLSYFMAKQFGTKILNIPFMIFPDTIILAVVCVILYTLISQLFNKKYIESVDIAELLRKKML